MGRGVAEQKLHQQREQDGAPIEHEADNRHQEGANGKRPVFEDAEINDGMIAFSIRE